MDAPLSSLDPSALFDHAPCALMVSAEDGTILLANATFCQWTGYDSAELIGRKRWHEMLTIGGRIFHQTHIGPLLRMEGSVTEVKVDMLHRDGQTIPLLVNAVRRQLSHGVQHELAFFLTKERHQYERELLDARKRAEQSLREQLLVQQKLLHAETRLRLALNSGALFVWDFDPSTQTRQYEDGVALLLGHASPRPVTAAQVLAAMPAEDREAEAQILEDAVSCGKDVFQFVVRLNGVDGVQRAVSVSTVCVTSGDAAARMFVGVLQDISEHRRQRGIAEDRAKFAEQMVGIVSHDLRNPLSTIKMATNLMARDNPSLRQSRLLGHIDQSTDRAVRLIAELLDFTLARFGQGISVATKDIGLHDTVAHGLAELELAFPDRSWVHHTAGTGSCVADPDRLVQILGNLMANAVAYGAPREPIVVSTAIEDASFQLSVQNRGAPIPPALLASMFEPMTRGENVDTGSRSVGLGLFIVRAIVQAHGGTVEVSSTIETGTTFTASFPR